jgi:2-haloalkanoic acid dehalogenase type II
MSRYDAVVFDLLTALLDSWTLWDSVAGGEGPGRRWRMAYLKRTYHAGAYRAYEDVVAEAAAEAGLPPGVTAELVRRWPELKPWTETHRVLSVLQGMVPLGMVTNCSEALARQAVVNLRVPARVLVSAERAGHYKPQERPYRLALAELGVAPERALFVAGSAFDVAGAMAVGMTVYWHNRIGLPLLAGSPAPLYHEARLEPLMDRVAGGGAASPPLAPH